ncbi:hypothetical protein [Nitrospira sp. BLG_2]|uniref:hypothetical protein n=1 Tax=Nitrospira sp. BLG_2 TaxID=3397507 RepID=UPI003B9DB093
MPTKAHATQDTVAETRVGLGEATCTHRRIIEDILTKGGKRTGKVRCLECRAIFDDPYRVFK